MQTKLGFCDLIFDKYDKYNMKKNGVSGKRKCSGNNTIYENDLNVALIFILDKLMVVTFIIFWI